jgi:PAS domain S-box-containing protein
MVRVGALRAERRTARSGDDGTADPLRHPRTVGALGVSALAMGGSNQSLFLLGAVLASQGSAAVPLLVAGLLLSWAATPGWIELVLMWPNRVGGIAATCAEAFRPYSAVLANLTGVCYWWGWVPTCGLTALLSGSAIHQWFLPTVPVPALAVGIVLVFTAVNLCGVRWVTRLAVPCAALSAILAFLASIIPVLTHHVDWHQAVSYHLTTPFSGIFGGITSAMAGLYLIGFAAPAFEAATCHVGEMHDPARSLPKAVWTSAGMATVYFLVLPVVWLGVFGAGPLQGDLATVLGPAFAPWFGGLARSAAIWFMVFNMFHGTLQPLAGASRTLSQLSEDGLLPRLLARRSRTDCPWVATLLTAAVAIALLLGGDPTWMIAAANFTYLIGIGLPNVAVWLLRRNEPARERPYRAPRGTIVLGLIAALIWGMSTILGFEQFGLPTVIVGLAFAYSGSVLYAWRCWRDRRRAGQRTSIRSMHLKLTGAMLLVLCLDGAGYLLAVTNVRSGDAALVAGLQDIFVAVAVLTVSVGLVLPGMIAHAVGEVARAAHRLKTGTLADLTRAMEALERGDLDAAHARVDTAPVVVHSRDEVGEMAATFNTMQIEVARSVHALHGARDQLRSHRDHLEELVEQRTAQLLDANRSLEEAQCELVAREGSFRLLFEGNPQPMWVFDEETLAFLAVNDAAVLRYGWSRDEFLAMKVTDIRPETEMDAFVQHLRQHPAAMRDAGVWSHRLRDGKVIDVEVTANAQTFQGRRARLVLAQDVTERVALMRDLESSNEQRRALLARLVSAQEDERQRIASDIHDDAVQVMTAAKMRLDLLIRRLDDERQASTAAQLSETVAMSIARLRHLLFELTPPALDRHGLAAALRVLAEESGRGDDLDIEVDCRLTAEPDLDSGILVYRIVQEALTNVRKHAQAAHVVVGVVSEHDGVAVRVVDDGVGFDPGLAAAAAPGHLGLAAMRERAQTAGGRWVVTSAPGRGTTIAFWVPCTHAEEIADEALEVEA